MSVMANGKWQVGNGNSKWEVGKAADGFCHLPCAICQDTLFQYVAVLRLRHHRCRIVSQQIAVAHQLVDAVFTAFT